MRPSNWSANERMRTMMTKVGTGRGRSQILKEKTRTKNKVSILNPVVFNLGLI